MKKTVATIALLTLGGAAIIAGQPAQATEVGNPSTEGTVSFIENDGTGGLIKPGTVDTTIKLPDNESASTTGSLRLTNVPYFNFGSVKVSAQEQNYPSLLTSYQTTTLAEDGTITPSGTDVKIPQFVQVADERGAEKGVFKVSATATNFTETNVAEGETADVLENTRIQFYGQTLTNNALDKVAGDATTILKGMTPVTLTTTAMAELNATPLTILSTVTEGGANASVSSVVFDGSYKVGNDYSSSTVKTGTNDQVKLHVPTGESPKSDVTYTSTISWVLSDTL